MTNFIEATYSPEDNKLRLYPSERLPQYLYNELKEYGYRWAAKQELFVAPMWTPGRADLAIKLCGPIGDETTTRAERAEQRAERFEGYQQNRANDAEQAYNESEALSEHIPLGQPILIGHHSEKRARKQAEKITRAMDKAVSMWDTSEYWAYRVKGVISSAAYKDRADVRARRVKNLEKDLRKYDKNIKQAETLIKLWSKPDLNREEARHIANYYDHFSASFTLEQYPRSAEYSQYEGPMDLWSALEFITVQQAIDLTLPSKKRAIEVYTRWKNHVVNRLAYENAILKAQGYEPPAKKPRPAVLPMLNYRAPEGITVKNPRYYASEYTKYTQVKITKEAYKAIPKDYKGTAKVNATHRVKIAMGTFLNLPSVKGDTTAQANRNHTYYALFITDSKEHEEPTC